MAFQPSILRKFGLEMVKTLQNFIQNMFVRRYTDRLEGLNIYYLSSLITI